METELGRLRLLAAVSDLLTTSNEPGEALRELSALFVPALADWAVIDVVVGPDRVARHAIIHRDPTAVTAGRFEGELPRMPAHSVAPLVRALRDREVVVLDSFPPPASADSDIGREQLGLFAELGATHALVVPLVSRGEAVGALTLVRTERDAFGSHEVALVEGVARRTALAVENSRLYAQHIETAVAFQRDLLPALPQPDDLRLVARYVPARQGSTVGGDWYDAFMGPDGVTTLVIGDVMGHDQYATAHMAELRNLLRGCAWHAPASPAAVLMRLNEVVRGLDLPVLASVLCARIEEDDAGGHRLLWSSAGHLPPLLVPPGGPARFLPADSGVMLGVTETAYEDRSVEVPPGSKLVLYTDGLIEHRGDLTQGLAGLREVATELADEDLDAFCDAIITRCAGSNDDDVALLGVGFPGR